MKRKLLFAFMSVVLMFSFVYVLVSCGDVEKNDNPDTSETEDIYYTVTFKDYDGTILQTSSVKEGSMPTYNKSNPTRKSDGNYSYTFSGWSPSISSVSKDAVYIAEYTRTSIEALYYTITFKDYDGTILQTSSVKEGSMPTYNKSNPTRKSDGNYSYTFSGWSPSISSVSKDAVYIAEYTRTSIEAVYYTITFKDYDGTILQTSSVKEGSMPTYNKSNPTRKSDGNYSYTFSGWSPSIKAVNGDTTYIANYTSKALSYNVVIDLDGGTSNTTKLQFKTGEMSKDLLPFDVKKEGYAFKGYSLNNVKVYDEKGSIVNNYNLSSNMTFKAIYEESVTLTIKYTMYNPNTGSLIETYKEKPTDVGNVSETRSYKYNTYVDLFAYANEGYTFVGWYSEGQVLSNEKDYKYMMWDQDFTIEARFKYKLYDLNVWSNDADLGSVMIKNGNSQLFYNEETLKEYYTQQVTIATYTKSDTVRFLGWYNELNELVSTNAIYTFNMLNRDYKLEAKWNKFSITYDSNEGVNNSSNPNTYNIDMQDITLLSPTRVGYTFGGWEYNGEVITKIKTSNACHMSLKALWTVNTNTAYKVEHYKQNINNNNYTLYETDDLEGTTDTLTSGSVKTYVGFTSPETITQVNIDGDGSTVIKLYYTRNSYSVNLSKNIEKAGSVSGSGSYKYEKEATITATTKEGYTFIGWYKNDTLYTSDTSFEFTITAEATSFEARWTVNTNTAYKVEHYKQNINNNNYTLYETDDLEGTTDTLTSGSVKTYVGFTSPETITQVNIDGDGSTVIKLYYTRNSYSVNLSKNIEKAGSVSGSGSYKYEKEATITATTKEGYTFIGWYKNDTLYTNDTSFEFTITVEATSFEARYSVNKYTITLDNQASDVTISGITSGSKYEYGTQITLTATNNSGLYVKWQVNGVIKHYGNEYTFAVPSKEVTITTTTTTPYTREDNKIYFGKYPQTKVEDDTLISSLNDLAGENSTSSNMHNWTSYKYYISGSIKDYMFYQDVDIDLDGSYDYRGVYFTSYRPYYYSSSSSYTYQDDNGYDKNTIYWFSYDPIEWDILNESDGKTLIIANLILDSQEYYPSSSSSSFSHNGGDGYANNYELSAIRKFLNDNFYNTAFNDLEKAIIETTTVDNSASSTGYSSNSYACSNTNDKMFLLSYKEAYTYYSSSTAIQAKGTDYAKCQGLYVNSSSYSHWWLRSPYDYGAYYAQRVDSDGDINYYGVDCTYRGVRPACYINLG